MADFVATLCTEKKCPCCGETFYIPAWMLEGYTYRLRLLGCEGYKYYCSYSCYSKIINDQNIKFKKRYKNG